jgi:hypothetical protein
MKSARFDSRHRLSLPVVFLLLVVTLVHGQDAKSQSNATPSSLKSTSGKETETVLTGGGAAEISSGSGVKIISIKQTPAQLRTALGNGAFTGTAH